MMTATAPASAPRARHRGSRKRNRSPSPNMASRPATAAPISRMSFSIPTSSGERHALLVDLGPGAAGGYRPRRDQNSSCSRSRRSTNIGWRRQNETSAGGSDDPADLLSVWNWDARPFPAFPETPASGATPATGPPATGSRQGALSRAALPPAHPRRPPMRRFPRWRGRAGRPLPAGFYDRVAAHVSGRESRAAKCPAPLGDRARLRPPARG